MRAVLVVVSAVFLALGSPAVRTAAAADWFISIGGHGLTAGNRPVNSSTVRINGRRVKVSIDLWRDFMPGRGFDDSLNAWVTLSTTHRRGLPGNLTVRSIRFESWGRRWSPLVEPMDRRGRRRAEFYAGDGPRWAEGTRVRAVVELTDGRRIYRVVVPRACVEGVY